MQWGGRSSRSKFEHIVDDLVTNCEDQWREGNDLHLDTLDVYLIEVRGKLPCFQVAEPPVGVPVVPDALGCPTPHWHCPPMIQSCVWFCPLHPVCECAVFGS